MTNPFTRPMIQRAEHAYVCHSIEVPAGFDPDAALDPAMWALVAEPEGMAVNHEIRIVTSDAAWVQRLIVTFRKGSIMHVARESLTQLKSAPQKVTQKPAKEGDRYKVEHRGPKAGWCVIDTKAETEDKQKLFKNGATREEAEAELQKLLTPA